MNKFFALLSAVFLCLVMSYEAKAASPLEKAYLDIGNKELSSSLSEAGDLFHSYISVPEQVQPINFTNAFGKLHH